MHVQEALGIELLNSMVYHIETDKQSKRVIQMLEDMLQVYGLQRKLE